MYCCLHCSRALTNRRSIYCSFKCQNDFAYSQYIDEWKRVLRDGGRGRVTRNFSQHVIRYLREQSGNACQLCGWDKAHPITGRVPLEIDHIDGNAENNTPGNLRLICPNCHALTANYRNLNSGKGRTWRRQKYIKSQ